MNTDPYYNDWKSIKQVKFCFKEDYNKLTIANLDNGIYEIKALTEPCQVRYQSADSLIAFVIIG